jgi:hypothetical protein
MSTLLEATEHQARARVALSAALAGEPSHAYLFRGPRGSGKRAAARHPIPTWSGSPPPAPSTWSRRCASG